MNGNTLKKDPIIDRHFGELVFIEYQNKIINDFMNDYFGFDVSIDYFSKSMLDDNILNVKGFIRFNDVRVPFKFCGDMQKNKGFSMDISLYYDVVYSRIKDFKDDNYYNIKSDIKNVIREQVADYTQRLIACLPSAHSKELAGVLSFLYFYPHIDKKNGKTLKIFINLTKKNIVYFINHYQSKSSRFKSNLIFFFDGETFSLNSSSFTSIDVKNIAVEDYWKHLITDHFGYSRPIYNFINSHYTSINDLMGHIDEAFLVLEMENI